jgi:hypothetical protein
MRLLALALLLFVLPVAYAGPVDFTYEFSVQPDSYSQTWGPGPIYLNAEVAGDGSGFTIDQGNYLTTFTAQLSGSATATPFGPSSYGPSATIPIGQFSISPGSLNLPFNFGFSAYLAATLKITDTASGDSASFGVPLYINGTSDGWHMFSASGPDSGGVWLGGHYYTVVGQGGQEFTPDGPVTANLDLLLDFYGPPAGTDTPTGGEGEAANGPLTGAPEPSSLLLAGLGLFALARAVRRGQPE